MLGFVLKWGVFNIFFFLGVVIFFCDGFFIFGGGVIGVM